MKIPRVALAEAPGGLQIIDHQYDLQQLPNDCYNLSYYIPLNIHPTGCNANRKLMCCEYAYLDI